MSTFTFCETLGGTPIGNPGTAPAAGFRIGGAGGPAGGSYVITNNGAPFISGKTYNNSGEFIETILNPPSELYKLELRENPSLPVTDTWVLTVSNANNLPAAIPRERQNDPTDDPRFIDLGLLGKNPLLVIVLTADSRFQADDTVNLTYIAKVTGQPDVVVTLSGTVTSDQFGQKQPLILQVPNNKVSAGAVVTIDYTLFRGPTPEGQSDTATAQVIGVALPDLFAPRFQKSIAGKLDPLDPANLQGANAQAEVLDAVPGDTAIMVVQGAPGAGSPTFTAIPFNTNKRANFALSSAFLAANMGKPVKFYYEFIRAGISTDSDELDGSVEKIADHDPRLPLSTIDGIVAADLDVTTLLPTSKFQLPAWAHQVSEQNGWLRYEGVDSNNNPVFYDDLNGDALGAGPGLVRPVPLTWLQGLKDGSLLKIQFSLNYDGMANAGLAVKFPDQVYTIKAEALVDPIIEKVNKNTALGALVPDRGSTYATTLVISGTASAGRQLQVLKNGAVIDTTTVSVTGTFSYTHADATQGARSYTVKGLYGTSPVSAPWSLTVKVDTWRDSIVDFIGGNPGGWVMGPASSTAVFRNGYYENLTYPVSGNSGNILTQAFQLEATRTYRLSYSIKNLAFDPLNVPPVISVKLSDGSQILNPFSVPKTNTYYQQTANFKVGADGNYIIIFFNQEDRGGYGELTEEMISKSQTFMFNAFK